MDVTSILFGILIALGIAGFLEVFTSFDKKLVASLTLVAISYIYVGFAVHEGAVLLYVILVNLVFTFLAYYGYKKHFIYIVVGLILHGIWDVLYPWLGAKTPEGYDLFCIVVDFLLAAYFYWRLKPNN